MFNGDIGVVVASDGGLMAAIERGRTPLLVHPNTLLSGADGVRDDHPPQPGQPVPQRVGRCCPEADSPLLTRQLLYTAITRAQQRVRIIATQEAVAAAVARHVQRASGLARTLREG